VGDDFQFTDIFFSILCVMPGYESTIRIMYGLSGGLAYHSQLPDGQNNFSPLVIIPSANNHTYAIEEGATHEEI